ncbi:MAG: phosphatidylserine decarboxylase, partial [Bryobacteraceae bacterium]
VVDGIVYALASFGGGFVSAWLTRQPLFAAPFFVFGIFSLYFFRDPDREVPGGHVAVSPADGKVVSVKSMGAGNTRVSIFLNIFDVHVNRSPIEGRIVDVQYKRGQFLVASKEIASTDNEQNNVTVEAPDGTRVVFSQIAGLIARRIVFRKKVGDAVERGERIGMIKFGSRLDVVFGPEWLVDVAPGNRVKAASSILARRAD